MFVRNLIVKALATTASRLHWGSIMVMLREVILWLLYAMLLLWLLCEPGERLSWWPLCQPGENKRVSKVPTASESSSSLSARALHNLSSTNSADILNSKTLPHEKDQQYAPLPINVENSY